jgi:hypothetical protein
MPSHSTSSSFASVPSSVAVILGRNTASLPCDPRPRAHVSSNATLVLARSKKSRSYSFSVYYPCYDVCVVPWFDSMYGKS